MSEILISIKPKYLDLILSGRKTVELRKRSTKIRPGTRLLLYASSPRCAVIGEAHVSFREELPLEELWAKHGAAAAIGRDELDAYYASADAGVVLGLVDVHHYPVELPLRSLRAVHDGFRPPQSYMRAPAFIDVLLSRLLGWPSDRGGSRELSQRALPFVVPAE
ncbi:ASCH domain-containing protein [Paraliomyxa miuraensis]|uniref:ASCH domain-containing protein n=1 Tax=Paraliomyxa miuraensis TaxID=376150 RepID=UPI0022529DD9|nr:ASCH domain-containing protein [Paraliomyxa miuraensis]MCX4247512.1 ASCH domain-containing protein [Paraliomyxa miuraensis]